MIKAVFSTAERKDAPVLGCNSAPHYQPRHHSQHAPVAWTDSGGLWLQAYRVSCNKRQKNREKRIYKTLRNYKCIQNNMNKNKIGIDITFIQKKKK